MSINSEDSAILKQLEYCVRHARATSTRLAMIVGEMGGLQNDDYEGSH